MMKFLWLFLAIISIHNRSIAQQPTAEDSPYRLSWQVDIPVATAALGMGVSYLILHSQTEPMSDVYINSLNRDNVLAFDRPATYNWSRSVALGSDVLMYSSFAMPLLLLADKRVRKDYLKFGVLYAEVFALTVAATSLTKNLVKRPRPFVYNDQVDWHYKKEKDAQYSFFSGHTSMTAAMCFLTAKLYHDYNKGSKAVPWVWAAAATVPAVTGILRQQAGKHYWTDVITGYVVGAAIGILIPELHKATLFQKKKAAKPSVEF